MCNIFLNGEDIKLKKLFTPLSKLEAACCRISPVEGLVVCSKSDAGVSDGADWTATVTLTLAFKLFVLVVLLGKVNVPEKTYVSAVFPS